MCLASKAVKHKLYGDLSSVSIHIPIERPIDGFCNQSTYLNQLEKRQL